VRRGAAHELGRASCLLGQSEAGRTGVPAHQEPWHRPSRPRSAVSRRDRWDTKEGEQQGIGKGAEANRPETGRGGLSGT
jgi:hypothetical protein